MSSHCGLFDAKVRAPDKDLPIICSNLAKDVYLKFSPFSDLQRWQLTGDKKLENQGPSMSLLKNSKPSKSIGFF